jgi:hypothetical protein
MKTSFLILSILFMLSMSIAPSNGQVKMSEYQPLNMNEMLLLPRIKSQKNNENYRKFRSVAERMVAYFEVNEIDDLFKFEILEMINEAEKNLTGDLVGKDAEIQKFDYRFQKITRDFEAREREGVTKLRLSYNAPIYNIPDHPIENSSVKVIGRSNDENTFIIGKYNDDYLKVKFKNLNGYVHKQFLK